MNTNILIKRRDRVSLVIKTINEQAISFSTFNEVLENFIIVFDSIELSAYAHNSKIRVDMVDSLETVYMSVPSPEPLVHDPTIYISVATKHIIFFSVWGAVALYRKLPEWYDITAYRDTSITLPLLNKPGANGRTIWGLVSASV